MDLEFRFLVGALRARLSALRAFGPFLLLLAACSTAHEPTRSEQGIAGINLTGKEAEWVDYIASNVVPQLPGSPEFNATQLAPPSVVL